MVGGGISTFETAVKVSVVESVTGTGAKVAKDVDAWQLAGPAFIAFGGGLRLERDERGTDRKSTRLNSSHQIISYAVFCLTKKTRPSPGALVGCQDKIAADDARHRQSRPDRGLRLVVALSTQHLLTGLIASGSATAPERPA